MFSKLSVHKKNSLFVVTGFVHWGYKGDLSLIPTDKQATVRKRCRIDHEGRLLVTNFTDVVQAINESSAIGAVRWRIRQLESKPDMTINYIMCSEWLMSIDQEVTIEIRESHHLGRKTIRNFFS